MRRIGSVVGLLCLIMGFTLLGYWYGATHVTAPAPVAPETVSQIGPFRLGFDPTIAPTREQPMELIVTWPDKIELRFDRGREPHCEHPVFVNDVVHPDELVVYGPNGGMAQVFDEPSNPMTFTWVRAIPK